MLYAHYIDHPDELPAEYRGIVESEGTSRAVADHISGMTDRFAINTFKELFIPEVWKH